MLRISKIMDYGTLVLTHMAGKPQQVYSASELAATLGLGQATVSKILKQLTQHEILVSTRGSRGGYSFCRDPDSISIANVLDALEEQPFGVTECTATPGMCSVEADCHLRSNWERINNILRKTLEGISMADMLTPMDDQSLVFYPNPSSVKSNKSDSTSATKDMELI